MDNRKAKILETLDDRTDYLVEGQMTNDDWYWLVGLIDDSHSDIRGSLSTAHSVDVDYAGAIEYLIDWHRCPNGVTVEQICK